MEVEDVEERVRVLTLDAHRQHSPSAEIPCNSEQCYALLDTNSADKEKLQEERLRYVLCQLQREREDIHFSRDCIFCKKPFTGNRSVLLDHMMEQHNFLIGAPDNIVFINELLDHLEQMLKDLKCLYCEKVFRDQTILKEHMRKKQHKRINPQNKTYDRFYLINYLELGKTWKEVQEEEYGVSQEEDEKEMMDFEDEDLVFVCLFCEFKESDSDKMFLHMKNDHMFDFKQLKETHKLNFYHQIKLINYIRKKVHEKECISCDLKFNFQVDLLRHMAESGHAASLPEKGDWDQPSYYFSTFENDNLLCALDVEDSDCQECLVFPEDSALPTNFCEEMLSIHSA
ncbi:hypothetical protein JTE90_000733 [Oedothorax gibbosus]|uniref:C2H2-type domain-containing protein n=1 Tax=Oedothorax gibbosus TaxID=931172 RepID=A0AAV6UQB4_9ARAC|nr:hypothetical protein JTE90_000733 [Oedothorax gibbosus]